MTGIDAAMRLLVGMEASDWLYAKNRICNALYEANKIEKERLKLKAYTQYIQAKDYRG